jgi:hypothetical protein
VASNEIVGRGDWTRLSYVTFDLKSRNCLESWTGGAEQGVCEADGGGMRSLSLYLTWSYKKVLFWKRTAQFQAELEAVGGIQDISEHEDLENDCILMHVYTNAPGIPYVLITVEAFWSNTARWVMEHPKILVFRGESTGCLSIPSNANMSFFSLYSQQSLTPREGDKSYFVLLYWVLHPS